MNRWVFALVWVLASLCGTARLDAQPVFGAISSIRMPILIQPKNLTASPIDWQVAVRPSLSDDAELFSFRLQAGLSYAKGQNLPTLDLDRVELSLFPLDFLKINLGRFSYLPGKANLLSQTDFFARTDLTALISGDAAGALLPSDLAQIDLYGSSIYLKLTAQPISEPIVVPDPSSPWFPHKGIPQELSFTFPTRQTLNLGDIVVDPTPAAAMTLSNASLSAEVGGSFPALDASVLYYHGRDYAPILRSTIVFPTGLYGSYDVHLVPIYPVIDALGLNLSTSFWRMRAWIDSSFTFEKTFLTQKLAAGSFSNQTSRSPYLAWTGGTSLKLDRPPASFSVEYSAGHRFRTIDAVVEPLFSSVLVGSADLSLLERKLNAQLTLILSTSDWSAVQFCSLSFDPSESLEVSLSVPFFAGAQDSDFGQFKQNYQLTSSVTWRF